MKDLIKNAFDDIKQDIEESIVDLNDYRNSSHKEINRREIAWAKMFVPHLLGAFLGIAVARIFSVGFAGYVIFGMIFAFLAGLWKSYEIDCIQLKNAVVKNALLMCILAVLESLVYIVF